MKIIPDAKHAIAALVDYKDYEYVDTEIITTTSKSLMHHELNKLAEDNNIIDVKFSTTFNSENKKFIYSALVFIRSKRYA
mgnify:CR=1 FL=1